MKSLPNYYEKVSNKGVSHVVQRKRKDFTSGEIKYLIPNLKYKKLNSYNIRNILYFYLLLLLLKTNHHHISLYQELMSLT